MKKIILFLLFLFSFNILFGQFGRGSDYNEYHMPEDDKIMHSKVFKVIGLTLVSTGLYLAIAENNPQRVDVPIIIIGSLITIEGIRMKKSVRRPKYN